MAEPEDYVLDVDDLLDDSPSGRALLAQALEDAENGKIIYLSRKEYQVVALVPAPGDVEFNCPGGLPRYVDRRFHYDGSSCRHRDA